ncbi:hypothetical protein [uncultured Methylobacterium sp.]|uniref:hypothetical protein n=1 Tax=uncultured Methylobacterium sp. TaxID=157278 RepID=UPI0035CA864B
MTRVIASTCLVLLVALPAQAGGVIAVQQTSARNYVSVIQARNPFLTRSRTVTATTGNTTVTEIVAIGPDPAALSIRQAGLINRISSYQRGPGPNLDVRQDGLVNRVRGIQVAMP